jgi:hypothetical protein
MKTMMKAKMKAYIAMFRHLDIIFDCYPSHHQWPSFKLWERQYSGALE